ncbi:thiamine phosphate synthase [Telmatobacter sp. DSM 110680]|uniref:Thiamine phosphate synthase n=1 Tax=Telmatobacter sp. DSM 110680 TaxID=3036704 RepID=A0AAU7DEF2_9BACT
MQFLFPKVYPILDSSIIPGVDRADFLRKLGESLSDAGVTLMEYRNKTGSDTEILADSAILRKTMPIQKVKLILDDRADLVDAAKFDGVHVDAGDLSPMQARRLIGPDRIIGTFAGGDFLLPEIIDAPVDYLAIGPIFETRTKHTVNRPIGFDGVRRLREQAGPRAVLSAAAGITLETAQAVLDAGATMVAVAEGIFRTPDPAATFRRWILQIG